MGPRIYLNDNWKFSENFEEAMIAKEYDDSHMEDVRLPHTCKETPLHYFDEKEYQMLSGYRRILYVDQAYQDKVLHLTFDGVGHVSKVYINGTFVGEHRCGYTAFTLDISKFVIYGEDNVITVSVDSRENLNIPPFGFVIDYMTYGGIYRDVYLDVKEQTYLEDVFVSTKIRKSGKLQNGGIISNIQLAGRYEDGLKIRQTLVKKDTGYTIEIAKTLDVYKDTFSQELTLKQGVAEVEYWDVDHPHLYVIKTELVKDQCVLDEKEVTFGFRTMEFKRDGFYLNGQKFKIRGLNRHQSYPYVGYAMPKSMQQRDADIMKYELSLNAARTSHYPQSHYFLDRCDEIGLLVFTEIPGWQHIGDEEWKQQAIENVKDMVKQYRNHTSIMLWGVRINESVDDDDFYKRTNEAAHALDPTRQTGGVRCYKKSNLLEDVYTYNDFLHDGKRKGCDRKKDVSSDVTKGYLISEYNGHMYPTKAFDDEEQRASHAIRHANVLDEVAKQEDIAGSFGWCMFDYNTHKDFGSGDRICYHGVMDMFRNEKLAAAIYASQEDQTPVLAISSAMDVGEHPGCNRGKTYIITNADSVRMYKNDEFIKEYKQADSPYKYMKHGPILLDDYVGNGLEEKEGFSKKQAALVKEILNEAAEGGLFGLSKKTYAKAARLMVQYHMKQTDAVALYNKYVGDWGGSSTVYKFEAIKDGKVVKTILRQPMSKLMLDVECDHQELAEGNSYDVAAIRIKAVDEFGNVMCFANEPITLETKGSISLIGPDVISLQGGMGGTYVKTKGKSGKGKLLIHSAQAGDVELEFSVEK